MGNELHENLLLTAGFKRQSIQLVLMEVILMQFYIVFTDTRCLVNNVWAQGNNFDNDYSLNFVY